MRAKCGRCGTDFSVAGPGRYQCPSCGAVNEVRATAPGAPPPAGAPGGFATPPPPPPPEAPSDRVECPSCSFSFIVGAVESAVCPMCSGDVPVGRGTPQ